LTPTFTLTPIGGSGKIVFLARVGGRVQIFSANSDGSGVLQLTNTTDFFPPPLAWSAQGMQIVFVVRTNISQSIWVMEADGANPTRLATGNYPVVSPDGKRIAYISNQRGNRDEVWVMNVDGSGQTVLTNIGVRTVFVGWSPNSQRVLYISSGLFAIDAQAGKQPQRLSGDPRISYAAWSPDGLQIVYVTGQDIHIVDSNGLNDKLLTQGSSPVWSPNSQQLAYVANGAVYVMDRNGANVKQLAIGSEPIWSPDGRRIIYTSGGAIFIMESDGTNQKQIGTGSSPIWAP
jgi:Tol biopolymer transport system component